jgi:hypothetical protein
MPIGRSTFRALLELEGKAVIALHSFSAVQDAGAFVWAPRTSARFWSAATQGNGVAAFGRGRLNIRNGFERANHFIKLGKSELLRYRRGMTETETHILNSLVELETAVEGMAVANPKPNLVPLFAKLDALAHSLPPDADPDLRHYLQRKSYQKARLLLEDRNAENKRGSCGR